MSYALWIRLLVAIVGMLGLMGMAAASAAGRRQAFGPPKPGQWTPFEPMTDEFEAGKLDETKWWPCNPGWKGRQPALFLPKNVAVSSGKLHLTMRKEDPPNPPKGYHTFTSAAVKS